MSYQGCGMWSDDDSQDSQILSRVQVGTGCTSVS